MSRFGSGGGGGGGGGVRSRRWEEEEGDLRLKRSRMYHRDSKGVIPQLGSTTVRQVP